MVLRVLDETSSDDKRLENAVDFIFEVGSFFDLLHFRSDDLALYGETLADVGTFLQTIARCFSSCSTLRTCQINHVDTRLQLTLWVPSGNEELLREANLGHSVGTR